MGSVKGNEKEFRGPGLCSAGPSLNSGSPNLANPLLDLHLLPLNTSDTTDLDLQGNQGVFIFCLIVFTSTLCFVIALLNHFFKSNELSRDCLCKAFFSIPLCAKDLLLNGCHL